MEPSASKKLFVIDASAFIFRAYYALQPLSSKGRPSHAVVGFASTLLKLLREHKPWACVVVFDSKSPTFRKKIDSRYKANRPPPPEDLSSQIEAVRSLCESAHLPILQGEGFEADDWIASLVAQLKGDFNVVIVSSDKDLMQLVDDRTQMFDVFKNEVIDEAKVKEKWAVPPSLVRDLLILTGDSSDNVAGIQGVGPKTAAKLLNDYGSLDGVLNHINELTPKLKHQFEIGKSNLELGKQLIALKEDLPLPFESVQAFSFPLHQDLFQFLVDWDCRRSLENHRDLFAPSVSSQESSASDTNSSFACRTVDKLKDLESLIERIKEAKICVLDCETDSFDRLNSKLVGVGIAVDGEIPSYLPVRHGPGEVPEAVILGRLQEIVENPKILKIAHNLKFDREVFHRENMIWSENSADTMLLAYVLYADRRSFSLDSLSADLLGERKGDLEALLGDQSDFSKIPMQEACKYSAKDAQLTLKLFQLLHEKIQTEKKLLKVYEQIELPIVEILASMERKGILVDTKQLNDLSKEFHEKMTSLEKELFDLAGETFNPQSPKQLQKILFEKLGLKPTKKTKTGFSTDESVLTELALDHPFPDLLLRFRMLAKLTSTYVDILPTLVKEDGRIHTSYHQSGTATGRLSSSDPNLQNIPTRSEEGHRIRSAFVAPEGKSLLSADYSQIELRIFAHMASDQQLIAAFRSGRDIHSETARIIFGSSEREFRERAKAINYGIIYGISAFGLSKQLKIEVKEAARFMDAYFSSFSGIKEFMGKLVEMTRERGYSETLFGRRRPIQDIHSENSNLRQMAERMAINAPVQGTAADLMKLAMINVRARIARENLSADLILQVHDELVLEVQDADLEPTKFVLTEEMTSAGRSYGVTFDVPLIVDCTVGKTWAEL